jgi:hypothetical protein
MARTMLDEYKTPARFWAEAINTACYSINRLYLHRILKKTSYELLTGKKPNVSYFRVFGNKCFILVKRGRKYKFAPKAVEGFLLGHYSNTRAYRVFNKSTGLVEVSCDIVFDETNGSQVEQVDLDELDDEEASCVMLRNMSIRDACPKESKEPPQAQDQPSQASPPTQDEEQAQGDEEEDQEDEPPQEEDKDQGGDEVDQDKEDEQEIQGQRPPHPRVHQLIQRDHPVNSILGDIHKGVTTRSRVAHFCEHYSFVSSCRRFNPGGSLDRRVNYRRVSQPRWVSARWSMKGGRREGKARGLRVCPAPRSGALAVGGYKRPRGGRARDSTRRPVLPRGQPSRKRALDLPFIGVRKGSRCTMEGCSNALSCLAERSQCPKYMPSWQPERFWHPVHMMSWPSEERWSLAEGQLSGLSSPC